ncbi:MAG: serine/threonine protein kinase [Myxococcales bacterium]|nr:serine/threonine protein kinase [Myxococcales bacterium]
MKTCSRCGFEGDVSHCPNDGEVLLSPGQAEAPAPLQPTHAPDHAERHGHLAPREQVAVGSETVADVSYDDLLMRDENFGKWAEPEVKKKAADPMIGKVINGRYEVQSLLGQGGMGAVYKSWQPAVKRTIALKVLLREFSDNETVVKRFHLEAMAASRLRHPNTISVYDFGQSDDGVLYMAMEYLQGESLALALTRGGAMTPKRAVHIMRQVCKSLAEAHKAGIIHRDLKPDNIFLTQIEGERDFVKVLDFGVAKLKEFEGKEGTLTQAGMIFGTPKYMSPEQARSNNLDARSDIYALGVILYELLVGKPPFTGDNPLSVLIAHVNQMPRRFAEVNRDVNVPTALEAVVFRALSKDREQRQPQVEVMLSELEAVDELLAGASYDSVASRLPALLPGADGSPSLVGPAFVPEGSLGTFSGQGAFGIGGGTVRLDADGRPIEVTGAPPTGELSGVGGSSRRPRLTVMAAIFVGVPVLAAGLYMFLRGDPDAPIPTELQEPVAVPKADPALASTGLNLGSPALASTGVAATEVPTEMPIPSRATGKTCIISSVPIGARVYRADAPEVLMGITKEPVEVRLTDTTPFLVTLNGYKDLTIDVDPGAKNCFAIALLKPARSLATVSRAAAVKEPASGSGRIVIGGPGTVAPATTGGNRASASLAPVDQL